MCRKSPPRATWAPMSASCLTRTAPGAATRRSRWRGVSSRMGSRWLEEPLWPPEDHAGLARIRREGGVPIAACENAASLLDVQAILNVDAVDIIQPSVAQIGGITEVMKIAAVAEAIGIRLVPH